MCFITAVLCPRQSCAHKPHTYIYRAHPPAPSIAPSSRSQDATGGIVGITARNGAVLQISVNEATLVPYVVNTLRDSALAIQLAARLNLPGADDLYMSEFNRMLGSNDVAAAARLAGESPNGELSWGGVGDWETSGAGGGMRATRRDT